MIAKTSVDNPTQFFNGYGHFDTEKKEYVIPLGLGKSTPLPWVNIMANPNFGSLITENGASFTWFNNSYIFRLTPWLGDGVSPVGGELFYIKNVDTGKIWSPTMPVSQTQEEYVVKHGHGYSSFERVENGVEQRVTVSVDASDPIKYINFQFKNISKKTVKFEVTYYCHWILGDLPNKSRFGVATNVERGHKAILAKNVIAKPEFFADQVAYLATDAKKADFCTSRPKFFGKTFAEGDFFPEWVAYDSTKPEAGKKASDNDPCGAVKAYFDIEPGQEHTLNFYIGAGNLQDVHGVLNKIGSEQINSSQQTHKLKNHWDRITSKIQIETPNKALDVMFNDQVLYQVLSSRMWGRTGFYQPGGAFGFRDQIQDSLAFVWTQPTITKHHLLLAASRQFTSGEVQQWWHNPEGNGVKSLSSDTPLWLVYGVIKYVKVTGDTSILDELEPYLEFDFEKYSQDAYFKPEVSKESASVYEHCLKSIEKTMVLRGVHDLPLILSGDWNDSLSNIGTEGKGESVWLGIFLAHILKEFAEICGGRGDKNRAEEYQRKSAELAKIVEEKCWDGEWFIRAFSDEGLAIGSKDSFGAKIDSICQSWAVISGLVSGEKTQKAMASVYKQLVNFDEKLILITHPPYGKTGPKVGYIQDYPPGVKENGGHYNHAALWVIWATALAGEGDLAMELLDMTNPLLRAHDYESATKYGLEPYVLASDIYTNKEQIGRGGWSWYTASPAVYYGVVLENILGLQFAGDNLTIDPCVPKNWESFKVNFEFKDTKYFVEVFNPQKINRGVDKVVLDDVLISEKSIKLVNDQKEHKIEVHLGV